MSADIASLAEILINAVDTRTGTSGLTKGPAPDLDVPTAYDVQSAVIAARTAAGARVIGAKLGLTSKAKQVQMNVDAPLYGWLTHDMQIEPGAVLECGKFIQPRIEPEIAFVTKSDLEGPQVGVTAVLAATDFVCAAIDVLDSRYSGYQFTLPDVVADNASAAGFVLAGTAVDPRGLDLRLLGTVLERNGVLASTAAGAAVMGHPAAAVAWLVRSLAARGTGLPAGSIVLSGALTEAIAVSPGDTVTARIDRLGTVEIACR
jgi:2-keto-4-pentenoate hydratase